MRVLDQERDVAVEDLDVDLEMEGEAAALLADLDLPPERPFSFSLPSQFKSPAVSLTFIAGLLLGWLVIGWWLWPVQWARCSPMDLHPAYQARYVALVAGEYWRTQDASQARVDLANWDSEALSALLASLEAEASGSEARQQLAALRSLLALPKPEQTTSLWVSLFRQRTILGSMAVTVLLLVAALALAVAPRLGWRRGKKQASTRQSPLETPADEEGEILAPWLEEPEDSSTDVEDVPLASSPASGRRQVGREKQENPSGAGQAKLSQGGGDNQTVEATHPGEPAAAPPDRADSQSAGLADSNGRPPQPGAQAGNQPANPTPTTHPSEQKGSVAPQSAVQGQAKSQVAQGEAANNQAVLPDSVANQVEEPIERTPEDTQRLLEGILDGLDLVDPRREALVEMIEPIDIVDLVQEAQEILRRL